VNKRLRAGDPALRPAYVRSIVEQVEVGKKEIRITGSAMGFEKAVGRVDTKRKGIVPTIERKCLGSTSEIEG